MNNFPSQDEAYPKELLLQAVGAEDIYIHTYVHVFTYIHPCMQTNQAAAPPLSPSPFTYECAMRLPSARHTRDVSVNGDASSDVSAAFALVFSTFFCFGALARFSCERDASELHSHTYTQSQRMRGRMCVCV